MLLRCLGNFIELKRPLNPMKSSWPADYTSSSVIAFTYAPGTQQNQAHAYLFLFTYVSLTGIHFQLYRWFHFKRGFTKLPLSMFLTGKGMFFFVEARLKVSQHGKAAFFTVPQRDGGPPRWWPAGRLVEDEERRMTQDALAQRKVEVGNAAGDRTALSDTLPKGGV